ncbi:MAG: sigma-70 family RNA polymerase sigma factor [Proteobacteria bacterium]|nr:sigma-70 family RNA polymerase sigma factor [Pseudomonadota bacterium]
MSDFAPYIPRLRRYARALTGDKDRADDLVQDTLERALRKWALWRLGSRVDSWLFSIMHNIFVNQVRSAPARQANISLEDMAFEPAGSGSADEAVQLRDLAAALGKLSDEQREILLLVGLEEMSYKQVASVLSLPLGTVMSRLSRAREQLRGLLDGTARPCAESPSLKLVQARLQ